MSVVNVVSIFIIFFILVSCSYRKEKSSGLSKDQDSVIVAIDPQTISFQMVYDYILKPKCLFCHGNAGGVSLQSYELVLGKIREIERVTINELVMPPNSPLSLEQRNFLSSWIASGAPRTVTTTLPLQIPTLTPAPTPALEPIIPLQPTFTSLKKEIFDKKCIGCHYASGAVKDILFDKEEDLVNSPRDLVIPGSAKESGPFIAISRTDGKQMPPIISSIEPLSLKEIEIVKIWINETLIQK